MLKPCGDYVVVRTDPDATVSAGGILLPIIEESKRFGVIEALPDPVPSFMSGIKAGDRVLFSKGNRQVWERDRDGSELCTLPYYSLVAVVEDEGGHHVEA